LDDENSNEMPTLKASNGSEYYNDASVEDYLKMLKELDDEYSNEYSNEQPTLKASRFNNESADDDTQEREFNEYLNYLDQLNSELNMENEKPTLKASRDLESEKNHED